MNYSSEPPAARVLVVDDEDFVREAIELYFSTEGFLTRSASSGEEALERLREEPVDLAVLDIMMPGMDGLQLLREIKKFDADIEVVMASGCGTIESAIDAMRFGAYDYVTKPILDFDEDLLKVVKKALERRRLLTANRRLSADLKDINTELKDANGRLKRHVAELEVLYENGRMLGELASLEMLTNFVLETLQHQLAVPRAILVTDGNATGSWTIQGATGLDAAAVGSPLESLSGFLTAASQQTEEIFRLEAERDATAREFLTSCGLTPEEAQRSQLLAVPLKTLGSTHGFLVVPGENSEDEPARLLQLLAAQIAAPTRLLLDGEVTA